MRRLLLTILFILIYSNIFSQENNSILTVFNSKKLTYEESIDSVLVNNKWIYNNSPKWQQQLFLKILNNSGKSLNKNTTAKSFKLETLKPYSKNNGFEPLINIYPNPADDHITVQYAMLEKDDAITINIIDMQGRIIKTIKSANQIDEITIPISELKSGFYNVNFVSAKQGKYTVKISKK